MITRCMFAHPKYENQLLRAQFQKHHEQCQCITICSLLRTQQSRWILVRLILWLYDANWGEHWIDVWRRPMWIQNIIDRIVANNCYHTREHLWELWIAILLHSAFRSICLARRNCFFVWKKWTKLHQRKWQICSKNLWFPKCEKSY